MLKFLWYLWVGFCFVGTVRGNYSFLLGWFRDGERSGYLLGMLIGFLFFAFLPVLIYRGIPKLKVNRWV